MQWLANSAGGETDWQTAVGSSEVGTITTDLQPVAPTGYINHELDSARVALFAAFFAMQRDNERAADWLNENATCGNLIFAGLTVLNNARCNSATRL